MRKNIILIILGIVGGMLLMHLFGNSFEKHSEEKDGHANKEHVEGGEHSDEDHEKHDDDHDTEKESDEHDDEDIVKITPEVMKEFGIVAKIAAPGKIKIHLDLTGEVVPDPYKVAHVVPRFGGVVLKVFKRIGDTVKKGDKLALIESNDSLAEYPVISSIDGTILELHMTPGEVIGEQHGIMIANLEKVWAELNVYQKDLATIKIGQEVEFNNVEGRYRGKIFYISPTVDEETRTATVRIEIDNKKGSWKPGMFISAKAFTSSKKVPLAIDKGAIQFLENRKVVFVKEGDGFEPRPVVTGEENSVNVEILSGIKPGEKYIAEGSFTFKSEILKESFGGGHSH